MIYFKDYLSSISNKQAIDLHKKVVETSGLVKIKETKEILMKTFLKLTTGRLSNFQKTLLTAIYASESRGVTTEEINNYSKAFPDEDTLAVLNTLEKKMLIYTRKDRKVSYHGFKDLLESIYKIAIKQTSKYKEPSSVQWKNYSHYMIPHLITIISRLKRKRVRITNDNKIHLKNVKYILFQMTVVEYNVFSALPNEEFQFLVSFLNDTGCFYENDGILVFSDRINDLLLDESLLLSHFFSWWKKNKLINQTNWLSACINSREVWNVAEFSHMIASYEGPISRKIKFGKIYLDYKEKGLDWRSVPRMVKELWMLGGVDLSIENGHLQGLRWNKKIMDMILGFKDVQAEKESEMIFLPNFEILMDHHSNPLLRYQIELISDKMNNDIMSRYRISKDTVLKGLQYVFSFESFLELIDKLRFSEEQIKVIKGWASNFLCAYFEEISVLRLTNVEKWEELKTIPAFNNLVEEEILGFGVIFKKKNKDELHALLKHLGIFPKDGSSSKEMVLKPFNFYSEYSCKTKSLYADPIMFAPDIIDLEVASLNKRNKQKLSSFSEKLDLIKDAVQEKKDLEISFLEKKTRTSVKPLRIINEELMIATNIKTGCREQFEINEMTSLRVILSK